MKQKAFFIIFKGLSHIKNCLRPQSAPLRSKRVQELENSINITYGLIDNIFQILDTENVPVTQIISCLAMLSKKNESDTANIVKKPHNFMTKTKNYFKKTQMTLKNYIQISQRKGKKKDLLGMLVFSVKIQVSQHILQKIIPILKLTFHLTMRVFLKYMIILELVARDTMSLVRF